MAACKVIVLTPETSEKDRKTIEKEMRIHSQLKHRNILEFLDVVVVELKHQEHFVPGFYMLLELAAGGDLFDKIGPSLCLEILIPASSSPMPASSRYRCRRRSGTLLLQSAYCWDGTFSFCSKHSAAYEPQGLYP